MRAFKRALRSPEALGLEGVLVATALTLRFAAGSGVDVGVTSIGLGGADFGGALATAPHPGDRAASGPGLPAVPLLFAAIAVGAALGSAAPRNGPGVTLVMEGLGDREGTGLEAATRTIGALAAGAGVTLMGEG
ncbi:MAG: hypothetical protein M3160_07460 [Candidatus Eremiobacteraeota bacterium]|nr:hypothetical protein [Candidatus Eremiobacteraeota bacterium]